MNLILLHHSDFIPSGNTEKKSRKRVSLSDRRFQHLKSHIKPSVGDQLKVGIINGNCGSATVERITDTAIELVVSLDQAPPKALAVTLIMALPRPKMLKRTLQTIATMGVKQLYLINSYRVDKSFWSSPVLQQEMKQHLILGLEQAGDTLMPEVHLRKRFKPFVEDELPAIAADTQAVVAHPYNAKPCPPASQQQTTLVIGPEGGFIPYEIEKLVECGFEPIHIGERILRVETAVPALLSRLFTL